MAKDNSARAGDTALGIPKDGKRRSEAVTTAAAALLRSAADVNSLVPETVAVAKLLTQEATAEILGVSPKWLERDRWAERRIPFVKIGRLVRYRAADVSAYIEANIQGAA